MKKMIVFNQSVAGYLMLRKFVLKSMSKNKNNSNMNVFVFEDTEKLRKAISEYDQFIDLSKDYLFR